MNIKTKRICTAFTAAVMTCALAVGTGLIINNNNKPVLADNNEGAAYYYSRLSANEQARKFYGVFEKLDTTGEFKKGKVQYDLVANDIVSAGDVGRYVNDGNKTLPVALGAGRDSYFMDNPDLFYIDIYGTSISAGSVGSQYAAYLDSSRTDTLYLGDLNTEAKISTAISEYEAKINQIVTLAKAAGGVKEQIEYVNDYIATNTEYSFGTVVENGRNVDTPAAAYISTSYGALVNGKAICGGFSKAFKAVMDRLEIPCVCVQGYAQSSSTASFEPHMWNYVQLEDMWYAVDVTYNAAKSTHDEYLLLGSISFFVDHQEDNIVSTSNFELQYPGLKPYNYGIDEDNNGMGISGEYSSATTDGGEEYKKLSLTINYEDKSVEQLQEEGKYLAFRESYYGDNGELCWAAWCNILKSTEMWAVPVKFNSTETVMTFDPNTEYVQFALINRAPDYAYGAGEEYYYCYNPESFDEDKDFVVRPSAPYANSGYGSYVPAPFGYATPSGTLKITETYDIEITYTESLKLFNEDYDFGLDVSSSRGNDTIKQSCKIENLKWDGDKKITFTFTPSKMYIHESASIYFTPINLVGVESGKIPNEVLFTFEGKTVVCSRVFNDGRQYMLVYGEPEMLDTSDVSVTDFKDENGNYYAESQRSQLILVASKPDEDRQKELDEALIGNDTKLEKDDIVASTSYEISLNLCGCITKVPNGSFMQVSFGFPEGYDPNDAGTTFKIYHYKHDDAGNIIGVEEIPVIINQYGIIAKVTSFSPFTIVQVKKTSAAVTESTAKNVYATVNGKGGSIKTENGEGGITSVTGNSVKYVITKDSGYAVASVYLNDTLLDASRYADGTLTLTAEELASDNMLEVTFTNAEIAQSYAEKNMTVYTPSGMGHVDAADINPAPSTPSDPANKDNTLAIILGVVIGVAVLAGAGLAVVLIKKKKAE